MRMLTLKHPLHPALVHLPVGLWMMSFVSDSIFMLSRSAVWLPISYACIAFGILGAIIAAPAGLIEYSLIPLSTRPRRIATRHMILNFIVLALYFWNFLARRASGGMHANTLAPKLFALNLMSIAGLSAAGYLGGLLVYEFGVGMRSTRIDGKTHLRRVA